LFTVIKPMFSVTYYKRPKMTRHYHIIKFFFFILVFRLYFLRTWKRLVVNIKTHLSFGESRISFLTLRYIFFSSLFDKNIIKWNDKIFYIYSEKFHFLICQEFSTLRWKLLKCLQEFVGTFLFACSFEWSGNNLGYRQIYVRGILN
jgi:hypothetical protein